MSLLSFPLVRLDNDKEPELALLSLLWLAARVSVFNLDPISTLGLLEFALLAALLAARLAARLAAALVIRL